MRYTDSPRAAGRSSPGGGERDPGPDRGDHREPVLRDQQSVDEPDGVVPDPRDPDEALEVLVERALSETGRGLGEDNLQIAGDAREALVTRSGGDARGLLNALEVSAHLAKGRGSGVIEVGDVSKRWVGG